MVILSKLIKVVEHVTHEIVYLVEADSLKQAVKIVRNNPDLPSYQKCKEEIIKSAEICDYGHNTMIDKIRESGYF